MIVLSIIGIIYGALVAMAQRCQETGRLLVGLSSGVRDARVVCVQSGNGINGAVMQMINHGISTGALFRMLAEFCTSAVTLMRSPSSAV
jgi:NADH-quinone oxidoreductase subunit M